MDSNNDKNLIKNKDVLYNEILSHFIQCVNNLGELLKKFQYMCNRLPKSEIKHNEMNVVNKNELHLYEIMNIQKEIHSKFELIIKLSEDGFHELPDKLFNTLSFMTIKFIDIINSNQYYLEQNTCGDMLKLCIMMYKGKSNSFMNDKIKYIDALLKLCFSLIDNVKLDIKQFINEINDFGIIVLCGYDNNTYKLSVMPGVVSKIVKVLMMTELKLNSTHLGKILMIMEMFMKIVLSDLKQNEMYNKFFEFYKCLFIAIRNKYMNVIIHNKILENIVTMNTMLFNNSNCYIDNELYEVIFNIINTSIFDISSNNNSDISNILSLYEKFYISCSVIRNYNYNVLIKRIKECINVVDISYHKREFHKFNSHLSLLCGLLMIYVHSPNYKKENNCNNNNNQQNTSSHLLQDVIISNETSMDNNINVFDNVIDLLIKILQNKEKIIFESINSHELSSKEMTINTCIETIKSEFLSNIIQTHNLELNFYLINSLFTYLFTNHSSLYSKIETKITNILLSKIKYFNSKAHKNKLTSKQILNNEIKIIINILCVYTFILIFPKPQIHSTPTNTVLRSIIQFLISFFCDNQMHFELHKIPQTQLTLINFYTMLLCIHSYAINISFPKQDINSHIILSMINYSSNISILKHTSMIIVLKVSKDNNIRSFIISNFNFIINTILNKIIYFNKDINHNKHSSSSNKLISYSKIIVLNFFTSLLDLINKVNDDTMRNYYCGEFTKYITLLFPYIDTNIKEKNFDILELLIELIYKISLYQHTVICTIYDNYKHSHPEKAAQHDLENSNGYIEEIFQQTIHITTANIFRKIILRICSIILSKRITLVNKVLLIIIQYIPILHIFPMEREEEENFSPEDPSNVIIKQSLGPVMHEIWKYLLYALSNGNKTIVQMRNYMELFKEIAHYYPRFYSYERTFIDLFPICIDVFNNIKLNYNNNQFSVLLYEFVFDFMWNIINVNKYNSQAKDIFDTFIKSNMNVIMQSKNKPQNKIENDIENILNMFNITS